MNILDYLASMGIDEHRVQEIAVKLERLADKYLEEVPVLDTRLQSISSQLGDLCAIARAIPVILEKENRMEQELTEQKHGIREINSKLVAVDLLKHEVGNMRIVVFVIVSILVGISAAALKHILSMP